MTARQKPKSGLRAALAAKKVRIEHFDVPLEEFDVVDAAGKIVEGLTERLTYAKAAGGESPVITQLEAALDAAKADLRKHYYRVSFRGLSEADFEAVVNDNPPTDTQAKAGEQWNIDTFIYALAEACCTDPDGPSADEWKAELATDRWNRNDRGAFINAVLAANMREFSYGIPKG